MKIFSVYAGAFILAGVIVGCSTTLEPGAVMTCPVDALQRIRDVYPAVSLVPSNSMNVRGLSGYYSDPGPAKLARLGGTTAGCDLQLSTDSTYVYLDWSDLTPTTTNETGRWKICDGFIFLKSDWTAPDSAPLEDHVYLPLILSDTNRLFLLGNRCAYSYYLEHGRDNPHDPEFMLLLRAFERK